MTDQVVVGGFGNLDRGNAVLRQENAVLRAENSDRYWAARSGKKTVQASTQVNPDLNR
ncbi:hypothetical protein AB0K20_09465 [Micromonospora matsumotoense]|uniref:hypothetical protein n=1 Tax=Micromonospora matsumotoense TaxID=121616 RepID=UPI0034137823